MELHSSDAPLDPRWTHNPSHSDPKYAEHKHHVHHHKTMWEGSSPSVHARIATDLLAMAVNTVLSASLSRASVLCEMHVHKGEAAANSSATVGDGSLHQTHHMGGKVSEDATALLNDLLSVHNTNPPAVDDDDERISNLLTCLMRWVVYV